VADLPLLSEAQTRRIEAYFPRSPRGVSDGREYVYPRTQVDDRRNPARECPKNVKPSNACQWTLSRNHHATTPLAGD
jgi:hypothetical protein